MALATLLVLTALGPASAQDAPATSTWRFDFGGDSSPVEDGWTRVSNTTLYTAERGYGLDRETSFRDRGAPDPVRRDFTNGNGYHFLVDVPDGDYHITVISGDEIASNRTDLSVEGVNQGRLSPNGAGQFSAHELIATVTDGQLDFQFRTDGRANGIVITQVFAPTNVHVVDKTLTRQPSVTLGWDAMDGAERYTVYRSPAGEEDFVAVASTTATTLTDDTVDLGYSYDYAVTQTTADGVESARSDTLTVSMTDPSVPLPAAPTELMLETATLATTALSWKAVDGALQYYVYRADSEDGPFTRIATVTEPHHTESGGATTNAYYRVVAVNEGGLSEPSEVVKTPITRVQLRQAEALDRGVVAVRSDDGVFVSWRLLGTEPESIAFNLYRDGTKVNDEPIRESTNYHDAAGTAGSTYTVRTVLDGRELQESEAVEVWDTNHLDVPLQRPAGGTSPGGQSYVYHANDASVGDLDGDGEYEIVLKWDPSNSRDNSQSGYTGNVILDAYELDGTLLWRMDLGRNIRAGAHYTQFLVYDFDGNGRSEVVFKTADGTVDGQGNVIGDPDADHRNSSGYVLAGPEFLTVFDGRTGAELATTDYHPPRGNVCDWGDCYGNRVDRFLAGVAYLDGERPSIVMARGYYTRSVLAAYDFRDGALTQRWVFDTDDPDIEGYAGQGNHSLSINDVDGDGRDEIIYGAAAVDDDGSPLHTSGLGHGDAQHVSDLDPTRPGLEIFGVHESAGADYGLAMRDGVTGEVIWGQHTGRDTGRGLAADIDPRHLGAEAWAVGGAWNANSGWLFTAQGELLGNTIPPANHAIWWDGDLSRELLDHDFSTDDGVGVGTIDKWDYENSRTVNLLTADGTFSNNGTKGNPALQADLFGDWREEVMWRTEDSSALRIYTTTDVTEHRIHTLMHDSTYRLGVAWQNVAYNQPPHTSFYLGTDMDAPPRPRIHTGDLVDADVDVDPDTWIVGNGQGPMVATVSIEVPDRELTLTAAPTVTLYVDGQPLAVRTGSATLGDVDSDGVPDLTVQFDGAAVRSLLTAYSGTIEVTVTGHLADGATFLGTDTVQVVDIARRSASLRGQLDELVAAGGITAGLEGKIRHALDQTELWLTLEKQRPLAHTHLERAVHLLLWQADVVERSRPDQGDAAGLRALAAAIQALLEELRP